MRQAEYLPHQAPAQEQVGREGKAQPTPLPKFGCGRYSHFSPLRYFAAMSSTFSPYSKAYGMPGPFGTKPAEATPTNTASKISWSVAPPSIAGTTWIRQRGDRRL